MSALRARPLETTKPTTPELRRAGKEKCTRVIALGARIFFGEAKKARTTAGRFEISDWRFRSKRRQRRPHGRRMGRRLRNQRQTLKLARMRRASGTRCGATGFSGGSALGNFLSRLKRRPAKERQGDDKNSGKHKSNVEGGFEDDSNGEGDGNDKNKGRDLLG